MIGNQLEIGKQLEENGWRQGSIVRSENVEDLLNYSSINIEYEKNQVLLVASQSCDVAHRNIKSEPFIELSIARRIGVYEDVLLYGKNPRKLHTIVKKQWENEKALTEEFLKLNAHEKISVDKNKFADLTPDDSRNLKEKQLLIYVAWLAARYSRPAFPTEFNDRIKKIDPRDKLLRKMAIKNSKQLTGIFIQILQFEENSSKKNYRVNMLGLLAADCTDGNCAKANDMIKGYANIFNKAGMDVISGVKKENKVFLSEMRYYKRFYYDDISFRDNTPLPLETEGIL